MAGGGVGAVRRSQAMFGSVGCTGVAIKEQSNGIIFFTFCKDHLDSMWGISSQSLISN